MDLQAKGLSPNFTVVLENQEWDLGRDLVQAFIKRDAGEDPSIYLNIKPSDLFIQEGIEGIAGLSAGELNQE